MATADKLSYLSETKTAIKDAIVAKGGTVEDGATFRSYAASIEEIPAGGGNVAVDEATIITNEDGTISTTIGGCWVDGLVDGPEIVNFNGKTGQDVSNSLTYDVMKQLISKGDRLRANISHASYGVQKGCTVIIDTSEESSGIYKLTCNYVTNANTETFTGNTNKETTGVWTCIRKSKYGSQQWATGGNNFYSIENGKVPSPFRAEFFPENEYFKIKKSGKETKILPTFLEKNSNHSFIFTDEEHSLSSGSYNYIFGNQGATGGSGNVIFGNSAFSGSNNFSKCINVYGTQYNDNVFYGNLNRAIGNNNYLFGVYHNWWNSENTANKIVMFGEGNVANTDYCFIEGKYNAKDTNKEYAHIVGNGTDNSNRANAYTLDWDGNASFAGTVSSAGADYAEFFEWEDGNPYEDDRVGYLVTLNGNKIKFANGDDDILGIISGTAMVLGDNAEWNWQGRFLTDDFSRVIYEDREVVHEAAYNEDGELVAEEWVETVHAPKINPDYDESKPYVNRRNRPEWDIVGMMGKLYVRDDGTAQVNGYVTAKNGIATASETKTNMRVMERVNENIIRVLLK